MSNIRPVQFKPIVNESLVDMLESALSRAKSGELVSGQFSGTLANGDALTHFSSTKNALGEIAALSRLMHRLHRNMDADE